MRISHQTKNAVKVLVFCAREPDKTFTVSEIASSCGITEYNAFKLVPILVRAGILMSIRGRNGGVRLALEADEISVGSVVRATEDRLSRRACVAGDRGAKDDMEFDDMVDDAMLAFVEILDQNTIADLMDSDMATKDRSIKSVGKGGAVSSQTST